MVTKKLDSKAIQKLGTRLVSLSDINGKRNHDALVISFKGDDKVGGLLNHKGEIREEVLLHSDSEKILRNTKKALILDLPNMYNQYISFREGKISNRKSSIQIPDIHLTFNDFITSYYGISKLSDKPMIHDGFLAVMGVESSSQLALQDLIYKKESYMSSDILDYSKQYLIPLILETMIRTGLEDRSPQYRRWINGSRAISVNRMTIPYALQAGNVNPDRLGEREDATVVHMQFEEKDVSAIHIGKNVLIGQLTQMLTPIPLLMHSMKDIVKEFARAETVMALDVLLNGDQSDGSWAASTVGTETAGTLTFKDLYRNYSRMRSVNMNGQMILSHYDAMTDLTLSDVFYGTNNYTGYKVGELQNAEGDIYPSRQFIDTHGGMPNDGSLLVFDPSEAVGRLVFLPLQVKHKENIRNQTDLYVMRQSTAFYNPSTMEARLVIDPATDSVANPLDAGFDADTHRNTTLQN